MNEKEIEGINKFVRDYANGFEKEDYDMLEKRWKILHAKHKFAGLTIDEKKEMFRIEKMFGARN